MWHTISLGETVKKLNTDLNTGLSEEQAKKIRERTGENKLTESKRESIFIKFIKQFNDFMIIILIAAAIVSAIMAYVEGTGDYLDSVIIIFIVTFIILGVSKAFSVTRKTETIKGKIEKLIPIIPPPIPIPKLSRERAKPKNKASL